MLIDNEFPISFVMGDKWKFPFLMLHHTMLTTHQFANGETRKCLIADELIAVVGRTIEVSDVCQSFFAKIIDIEPDGGICFFRLTLQRCEVR